jgi:glycosyltransferase involved in cell wall biosynthesis
LSNDAIIYRNASRLQKYRGSFKIGFDWDQFTFAKYTLLMTGLTVTIITHQEERNISRCLEAIKGLPGEILVVDSFSTDKTVEICESYGSRVILREFKGYVDQKQFAVNEAKNDWVLLLDADEVVTEVLKNELTSLFKQEKIPFCGYEIRFSLFYLGKIMHHSGVGFEHHLRLFNRKSGAFKFSNVHEEIKLNGPAGRLKGAIIHYSYNDLHHHLEKSNIYTSLAAQHYIQKGKRYHKLWVAFKFPLTFLIYYFIKGGILDGYPGFMWSFFAAFYTTVKIAKTIEMTERS